MGRGIVFLCVFLISQPLASNAETLHLGRAQAIGLGLERNEAYRSVRLESSRVEGLYVEARAGALPRLTLEGEYLRNIELPTSVIRLEDESGNPTTLRTTFGTPNAYRLGLSLRQTLYAGGRVGAALKIADYGKRLTDARIDASRNNTATEVDRAYLDAVALEQAVRVFREAEELADSNLSVVSDLYAGGQVSEYDMLRAQVRAANARPDRIESENAARLAHDRLRNLLALPPETELVLDTALPVVATPDVTLDQLLDEALSSRPELQQADYTVKVSNKLVDIARSYRLPDLSLSSTLQWQGLGEAFIPGGDEWYRSWYASLNLTWPLFTGFQVKGQVQQAKVDLRQSELALSQLEHQVRLEVLKALGDVQEAAQRVGALGETAEQAKRGVDIARVRFQNGMSTQLELLDAQVALTQAQVNRISALHDLAAAVSEMRRAVGRPWAPDW